jgi:hypothetical protein
VLKSAGVWYFLDVDSLNNRPAQLPNGTELAYVIGTKKIYRWNRALSVWEEYSTGGSSGLTMPFDSIYFNPTTVDPDTAELKYNADLKTFVFGADGTVIEIGQKAAWYVKNQTGSTIPKGTVVRAAGTLGSSGRILIEPMEIDGTVESKYLLGIVAADIADGSDGYVIDFGKLRKFNTSAWSDGDVLYADDAGGLTNVEPNPPNLRLPIAFVVHDDATNGVLAIRVQTGNELHELHDVDTTGINNGNAIVWDGSKWTPSAVDLDTTNELSKYVFNQSYLRNWRRVLIDAKDYSTGSAKVLLIGDSNINQRDRFYTQIKSFIGATLAVNSIGWAGLTDNQQPVADMSITPAGTWSASDNEEGLSLTSAISSTAASTYTITTSSTTFNIARIHYRQYSGGGTFSWAVDGGSATNVNTNGTEGTGIITISGLSNTTHTIVLTVVSGTVELYGIVADVNEVGARFYKAGNDGSTSGNWATSALTTTWRQGIADIDPDLVIIQLGSNDVFYDSTTTAYSTRLRSLIGSIRAAVSEVDIMIVACADHGGKTTDDSGEFATVAKQVAVDSACTFLSLFDLHKDAAQNITDGIYSDNVHWTGLGGAINSGYIGDILMTILPGASLDSRWTTINTTDIRYNTGSVVMAGTGGGTIPTGYSYSMFRNTSGSPQVWFRNNSGGADSKHWDEVYGTTSVTFRLVNDANSGATTWLTVNRSGTTLSNIMFGGTTLFGNNDVGVNVSTPNGFEVRRALSTTARGAANVRLGLNGSAPSLFLETTGSDQWNIDNASGVLRFVRNASAAVVQFSGNGDVTSLGNAIFQGSGNTIFNQSGGSFGIGTASPSGLQVNTTVSDPYRGTTNVRIGRTGNFPRLYLEEGSSSNSQWNLDVVSGTLRFVRNSSTVPVQFNSSGQVGFGATTPSYALDGGSSTNAIRLPVGTVAQRPTGANGLLRFNSDSLQYEGYITSAWVQLATRAYARSLVSALPTTNIYTADGSLTGNRTLHGAGYTLRFNANTVVRDSFKVAGLADHTDPDSIVTTAGGWLGKKKFLMPAANAYDGTSTGFFHDDFKLGFQTSGTNYYHLDYADTTGYWEKGTYSQEGLGQTWSGVYGDVGIGNDNFVELYSVNPLRTVYYTHTLNLSPTTGLRYRKEGAATLDLFIIDSSGTQRNYVYGTGAKEAADLSKTQSNYVAGFATDGTVLDLELKRDTTIYVTDADYNLPTALTAAQISRRYKTIIIYSKLTASATSDNQIILPSSASDYLQCVFIVYSNDASADADATSIDFTTNGAVDGAGGTVSTYAMVGGEKIEVRAVNDSGYKWMFY